ncbi:MAG TPA: hypothetical protein VH414_06880 [Lichenihabitans sp.]|jgi:hypothetical protein|nr:hypothetical protein [Lichenihabitans sp.]
MALRQRAGLPEGRAALPRPGGTGGERRYGGKVETPTRYVILSSMLSPAHLPDIVRAPTNDRSLEK